MNKRVNELLNARDSFLLVNGAVLGNQRRSLIESYGSINENDDRLDEVYKNLMGILENSRILLEANFEEASQILNAQNEYLSKLENEFERRIT